MLSSLFSRFVRVGLNSSLQFLFGDGENVSHRGVESSKLL